VGGGADEEGWGGEAVGLLFGGFVAARGHGGWLCVLRLLALGIHEARYVTKCK
jgi:hypothetical protein